MEKKTRMGFKLKIFLLAASAFALAGVIIGGIILAILPSDYKLIAVSDYDRRCEKLVEEMNTLSFDEACTKLQEFCITNQVNASIFGNSNYMQFDGSDAIENKGKKDRVTLQRGYGLVIEGKEYTLHMKIYAGITDEKLSYIQEILPVLISILGVLSLMAGGCISMLAQRLKGTTERLKQTLNDLKETNLILEEDISREKEREQTNRDFFAAASHELKTPVTILKGELEGMIYKLGDYQDRDKYLNHALEMTNQIENLIQEIMSISRAEAGRLIPANETLELGSIVRECIGNLAELAYQKALTVEMPDAFMKVEVCGDKKLWRKVVSNVIGNAVIHSPHREKIMIFLNQQELVVENSGVWIEEEHLDKLFQPFYRPDKSRSRDTGGSGLGLYLVKQVLDMYGYGYCFENTEEGIRFTVQLYQNNTASSPKLYQGMLTYKEKEDRRLEK